MRDDYFWTLFGGGFIIFWALLIAFLRNLRANRLLREREMIHKERVLALEKGVPLPDEGEIVLSGGAGGAVSPATTLAIGFVALCGGIGWILACAFAGDPSRVARWTLGLIPGMIGLGLLLNVWIQRRMASF